MKLEYLAAINKDHPEDDLVRLFDFDKAEVKALQDVLKERLLREGVSISLNDCAFIQPLNCSLTLSISPKDMGIQREVGNEFECRLTTDSYHKIIDLIQPFTADDPQGYQWLYDLDARTSSTEFLFSVDGRW